MSFEFWQDVCIMEPIMRLDHKVKSLIVDIILCNIYDSRRQGMCLSLINNNHPNYMLIYRLQSSESNINWIAQNKFRSKPKEILLRNQRTTPPGCSSLPPCSPRVESESWSSWPQPQLRVIYEDFLSRRSACLCPSGAIIRDGFYPFPDVAALSLGQWDIIKNCKQQIREP